MGKSSITCDFLLEIRLQMKLFNGKTIYINWGSNLQWYGKIIEKLGMVHWKWRFHGNMIEKHAFPIWFLFGKWWKILQETIGKHENGVGFFREHEHMQWTHLKMNANRIGFYFHSQIAGAIFQKGCRGSLPHAVGNDCCCWPFWVCTWLK